jgi:hypothetical protein
MCDLPDIDTVRGGEAGFPNPHRVEAHGRATPRVCHAIASFSAIPAIIQTMNDCMSQGVDIQLKILQTLLSLITNFPTIHGRLLADVRAFVLSPSSLP